MAEEIDFENGRNSNFEGLVTLTLTFDPAIQHIVLQQSSTSTYIHQLSFKLKKLFVDGRTYGRTDGRTFFPSILLGRLSEVDLIIGFQPTIIIITVIHNYKIKYPEIAICLREYIGERFLQVKCSSLLCEKLCESPKGSGILCGKHRK